MQKRGRALKVDIIIDGIRIAGLNTFGELSSEQAELDVGENGFIYPIFDGQTKFVPIEGQVLDQADNGLEKLFRDWHLNHETKDVTYVQIDGHGSEIRRIILPDAENGTYKSAPYDANGVVVAIIAFKLAFYRPIFLT